MVEWMGRNFEVFPSFQKISCYMPNIGLYSVAYSIIQRTVSKSGQFFIYLENFIYRVGHVILQVISLKKQKIC